LHHRHRYNPERNNDYEYCPPHPSCYPQYPGFAPYPFGHYAPPPADFFLDVTIEKDDLFADLEAATVSNDDSQISLDR
jgi:hypothetical protein